MKIIDEREILPIIRDAVHSDSQRQPRFKDSLVPLFDRFVLSDLGKDEYRGWTFDLTFLKQSQAECDTYRSLLNASNSDWIYISEGKDDCTYIVPLKGIVKIHIYSYLWFG